MMRILKLLIATVGLTFTTFCAVKAQDLLIRNTNIIDLESGITKPNMDVFITKKTIAKISSTDENREISANVGEIDGSGKYLIPGFIDTHVHFAMGEINIEIVEDKPVIVMQLSSDLPNVTANLLLKNGITTSRDPGGLTKQTVQIKKNIASEIILGPELFVAGSILDTTQFINLIETVKSKDEIVQQIRKQKSAGVDFIKFYSSLPPEIIDAGIREAHKLGLGTISHLHRTSWTDASRLGIDNIVHILPGNEMYLPDKFKLQYRQYENLGPKAFYKWFEFVDLESAEIEELIYTLKNNQTSIDPTLAVFHATFFRNTREYQQLESIDKLPAELVKNWRTAFNFNIGWTDQDFKEAQSVWPKVQEFVRKLYDSGIMLTTGTDANNPWVVPGVSFHNELRLLAECGIPNAEILKMATCNGAKLLKIENRTGSVKEQKEADLLLLNSNPLEDISNSQDIFLVINNGKIVDL